MANDNSAFLFSRPLDSRGTGKPGVTAVPLVEPGLALSGYFRHKKWV